MTNEEYALSIQQGHTELYEQLWENIKKLMFRFSYQTYTLYRDKCISNGITNEDMEQAGFIAIVEAVKDYKQDKGLLFNSYLYLHFKKCFMEMIGRRTSKRDMLECCYSLDVPVDEAGEITLMDLIEDPTDQTSDTTERLFQEQLHEAIEQSLLELPDNQKNVIVGRFYNNLSLADMGRSMNLSRERIRMLEFKALQKIRTGNNVRRLKTFDDEICARALLSTGYNSFANKQASSVELTAEWMERNEA